METKDIILKYIAEEFGSNIDYDTQLISGGYIDSFSMMVLLFFLEKTFKIKILDKDIQPSNFNTVNDMSELIEKYSNNENP